MARIFEDISNDELSATIDAFLEGVGTNDCPIMREHAGEAASELNRRLKAKYDDKSTATKREE